MKYIIYLIAFLEWFTTLSVEIVALRNFTPIVWTNSVSTSIVLGIILLALSYWYYIWGQISAKWKNIKRRLVVNLLISSLYYFFITFLFIKPVLQGLLQMSGNYSLSIILASVLLFFIPVFLASQTIPLLAELLKWNHSWEKMWKLLFYSTIGSFVWSVGTSVILFPLIGVFKTGIISSILLAFCGVLVSYFLVKWNDNWKIISSIVFLFFCFFIVSFQFKNPAIIFEKSNAYHNIKIYDTGWGKRIFSLDWGHSSWVNLDSKNSFFSYILEVEKKVQELKPKNILVIWAAGFTFPNDISEYDFVENIDVVDVDASLQKVAEKYFLEKKLSPKIYFYPTPSRYFLNNISGKRYDLILVDAYSGKSLPPQVLTYEFFNKLKEVWENIYLNIILDTDLKSKFSKNLFTTLQKSFWKFYYKDVKKNLSDFTNIIITNTPSLGYSKSQNYMWGIYRDDKNSIEGDLFKLSTLRFGKN